MITPYALFALSAFFPIYTYALYPVILKFMKRKKWIGDSIEPSVTVVIIGENPDMKLRNVLNLDYPQIEAIEGDYSSAFKADGDIIVFTDTKTELDSKAIREIVKPFADEKVGCAVGQQTNPEGNSTFWKYENYVRRLESNIGCVSGATASIFAVRKTDLPKLPEKVLNKPFFIATKITENGKAVVFQETAKAHEGKTERINFQKHIQDAVGYWQALKLFPKMLLFHHGSFVYVSHRVTKWFVWWNMFMMLLISILMMNDSLLMLIIFWMQLVGYTVILLLGRRNVQGIVGKLIGIGYYFMMQNTAYFIGLFRRG